MTDQRCGCGESATWYADNNGARAGKWYCDTCEDRRAELWGCARIMAEGCGCFPDPNECYCGCGGSGVLVKDYAPCANCGDEWSETIEWSGQQLCEECYISWKCGCDLCAKGAIKEWMKDNEEVAR